MSVLARKVSEVRAVTEKRLHATVAWAAHRADAALPGDLVATLCTAFARSLPKINYWRLLGLPRRSP